MFGSRTITEHLARGVVGMGAIAGAVLWAPQYPLVWLLAVPVALLAFRGCPMCWTVGLVETVMTRAGLEFAATACDACGVPRTPGAHGGGAGGPGSARAAAGQGTRG